MKILYYDCFSGISGDMNLGSMIDLGVSEAYLRSELEKLHLHNEFELEVYQDQRKGITGTRVNVKLLHQHGHHHGHEEKHDIGHKDDHQHTHHHDHPHTQEDHNHHKEHHHHEHHHDRNLKTISNIIENSELNANVKELSLRIFMEVAKAESKIHGKDINEVHFHEVGAVDSIVDIVGAAICFDSLKVDKVIFSPLAVGGGFVHCAHGKFPVPAPATTEILRGIPITTGGVEKELTTPTGAAIAKVLGDEFSSNKDFSITKIGYGIGYRDNVIPNVLRVFLAESNDKTQEKARMIECNIDDMNPEIYEYVMQKLLDKGAMDVYMTPIIMKKNRPSIKLSVLSSHDLAESMTSIILKETTTLGVRSYDVSKNMLERKNITISTEYGDVRVKLGILNDEIIKYKPEYEDCKRIAEKYDIPLHKITDIFKKHM